LHTSRRTLLALLVSVFALVVAPACAQAPAAGASPLQLTLTPGAHYSNIFSVAVSILIDKQPEFVWRNSGSATYVVKSITNTIAHMSERGRYDGRPAGSGTFDIDLRTFNALDKKGKQVIDTDSSGFNYNTFIWGSPPASIAVGTNWLVKIPTTWELGPAGTENVRVLSVNSADNSATLLREGSGSGATLDDAPFKITYNGAKVRIKITPASVAHWRGISTFKNGIVMADSILCTRDIWVTLPNGDKVLGHERLYTLVNVIPGDTY
jgi:hypothetical protein